MRLNLTQHKSTPEQECEEPKFKELVQRFLTFDEIPDQYDIQTRAIRLARLAEAEGATEAIIGGAPFLMPALEKALRGHGIKPLYAFSLREAVEENGVKKSIFKHIGFVEGGVF